MTAPVITARDNYAYVVCRNNGKLPRDRFTTVGEAGEEAERLSVRHPGRRYIVLKEIARVITKTESAPGKSRGDSGGVLKASDARLERVNGGRAPAANIRGGFITPESGEPRTDISDPTAKPPQAAGRAGRQSPPVARLKKEAR